MYEPPRDPKGPAITMFASAQRCRELVKRLSPWSTTATIYLPGDPEPVDSDGQHYLHRIHGLYGDHWTDYGHGWVHYRPRKFLGLRWYKVDHAKRPLTWEQVLEIWGPVANEPIRRTR